VTAPGGVIATVYVNVLPTVQNFSRQLRQQLRASSRQLRTLDRELEPVTRGLQAIGRVATGIVPGIRLTTQSLLVLGGHAVVGGLLSAAGAATTLSGALGVIPAVGVAAVSVVGALAVGLFDVSKTFKDFVKGPEDFAENIAKLSTNARATLQVFEEFRGEITAFRDAVQDRLFAGMEDVVRGLIETFLPRLQSHFSNLVDTVNLGVKELAAFAQTAETLADVDEVASNTETAFSMLRQALVPAGIALRDVVTVGSRFLPLIAFEVTRIVERFSEWIQAMRETGQLQEFFNRGLQALKQVAVIVGNVGRAIGALLGAARESGNGLLDTLEALTGKVADFLQSTRGQNSIREFLDSARGAANALTPVIVSLADLFFNHVFPIFERFAKAVGPAVAEFFTALGDALDAAAPGIVEFARGFGAFITAIIPALPAIAELVGQIGQFVAILAIRLGPAIAEIVTSLANILVPILNVLSAIFTVLPDDFIKLAVAIGVTVVAVSGLITVIRGVQAVVGLFAGGLAQLSTQLGRTHGGATGLVGFLGGPWGIALGVATTVLGLFLSTTENTGVSTDALRNSLVGLKTEAERVSAVMRELQSTQASDTLRQLGITTEEAARAIANGGREFDNLIAKLVALKDQTTGAGDDALDAVIAGLQAQRDAAASAATSTEELNNANRSAAQTSREAATAARDQANAVLAARDAHRGLQGAIDQANTVIAQNNAERDTSTQAIAENEAALDGVVSSTLRAIDADRAKGASGTQLLGTLLAGREAFLAAAEAAGIEAAAARKLADDLGLIPRNVLTVAELRSATAEAAAIRLKNLLDSLPTDKQINLRVNTTGTPGGHFFAGLAGGGVARAGEWTVVGEKGPELVRWGSTAEVFSNAESRRMASDVGALDQLTRSGTATSLTRTSSTSGTGQATTIDNHVNVQPTVHVFIDGQEFRGMVRVELDERDRQLQRLVISHAGTRGSRG
jgi:hypothetical protein